MSPELSQHSQVYSEVFEIDGEMNPERLDAFLNAFVEMYGKFFYRMKGIVKLKGQEDCLVIQVVRHVMMVEPLKITPDQAVINRFVLIAKTDVLFKIFKEWLDISKVSDDWREKMEKFQKTLHRI